MTTERIGGPTSNSAFRWFLRATTIAGDGEAFQACGTRTTVADLRDHAESKITLPPTGIAALIGRAVFESAAGSRLLAPRHQAAPNRLSTQKMHA